MSCKICRRGKYICDSICEEIELGFRCKDCDLFFEAEKEGREMCFVENLNEADEPRKR